jgi:hypothetical protein
MELDILILQMAKVGSAATAATILHYLPDAPLAHLHWLSEDTCLAVEEICRGVGLPPWWIESALRQVSENRHLRTAIEINRKSSKPKRLRIISMTRDPVGNVISSLFHNIDALAPGAVQEFQENKTRALDRVLHFFLEQVEIYCGTGSAPDNAITWNMQFVLKWPLIFFDRELKGNFGLDCYREEFCRDQNYAIYHREFEDFLIIRFENIFSCLCKCLTDFLGTPVPEIISANNSKDKDSFPLYREFLNNIELPERFLDRQYSSPYARHFYSAEELDAFASRWCKAKGQDS